MPRKGPVKKRRILPDPIYNSQLVSKFINMILRRGKKSIAQKIVYNAFAIIEEKTKESPITVFKRALDKVRPHVAVKSRRVGGATYQVPVEIPEERGITMAMGWIISFSKAQKGKPMQEKLAQEILNAVNNTGASIKKREDTHKMAEANKAFAHYRW
ncbi:MAG: 30S ribosomal protein S7 [bacterium]